MTARTVLSYPPLPPPTHSYVRPVLTHVFSAACYTGLATGIPRWWVVVAVDDTHTAVRSVDDVAWMHPRLPPLLAWTWTMRPSAIIGDRSTHPDTLHFRRDHVSPRYRTRADANTGVPNWVHSLGTRRYRYRRPE